MTTLYQLTVVHNEEDSGDHVEEFMARAQGHGLKVVDAYQIPDCHWLENWVVLQGSKDQFMSWGAEDQEGGPSFNEEELMEDLVEVED